MDFILTTYTQLLKALQQQGFLIQTFEEFLTAPNEKVISVRLDIDRLPQNALHTAKIENKLEIHGSYYFRDVTKSWDEKIIKEIYDLLNSRFSLNQDAS